jgi:hypothetical protein
MLRKMLVRHNPGTIVVVYRDSASLISDKSSARSPLDCREGKTPLLPYTFRFLANNFTDFSTMVHEPNAAKIDRR